MVCSTHNHQCWRFPSLLCCSSACNMALAMYSTAFGDVYGWICRLKSRELGKVTSLKPADVEIGPISLDAQFIANGQVSLCLCRDSVSVCELGICRIEDCSEEEMQQNLLPLFFRLCIYAFLRLTHEYIVDLKKKWVLKKRISKEDFEKLMRMDIDPATIEASIYKYAFNKLFSAACYFHFNSGRDNEIGYPETELKKLAAETLRIIRPVAADSLMKSLASKFTEILLEYKSEKITNDFKISYSSSLDGLWTIRCYCPRLSMKREIVHWMMLPHLDYALSHQLLNCTLQFRHDVKILKDRIEVELKIDNLRCKAFQLVSHKPIRDDLKQERYFPAKITITTGPETGRSALDAVNSGASSSNPTVNYSESRSTEKGSQTQIEAGVPPKVTLGNAVKKGSTNSTTSERRNWYFEASAPDNIRGRFQWTLYHNSYQQKPVFSYHPKHRDRYYRAFKDLAHVGGPSSPFTEEGGVEFAGDMYGTPIKWTFLKEMNGQTLEWFVECEIWMAYYPYEYSTRFMEVRYQNFRELVQLHVEEK